MLLFRDLGKTILTQHAIATTTEALLVEFKASSKDIWAAEHPGGNATLNSLDVRVDKLGERYALVTSISSTANSGVVSMAEQWDVYLAGKHFQLHLTWPKDADVSVKPALDALKASVKFE
jgi:hypothetical protein